jgi:hypothetical protein
LCQLEATALALFNKMDYWPKCNYIARDNFVLSKVPETEIESEIESFIAHFFSHKLICNLLTRAGRATNYLPNLVSLKMNERSQARSEAIKIVSNYNFLREIKFETI